LRAAIAVSLRHDVSAFGNDTDVPDVPGAVPDCFSGPTVPGRAVAMPSLP